jgi:ubiquinone/menaquinone biosynthesis C-methylase UbiE
MFGWFRTAAPARETGVAMVDPRGGNSLLVIGTAHPRLAATCAAVTGLNGRAVIVGRGATEQKLVEEAAAAAGALVEFVDAPAAMLPLDTDTFDVVVVAQRTDITHANDQAIFAEAFRVAKPAGRVIIVTGEKRAGIFGALQSATPTPKPEVVIAALKAAGGVAVRRLAGVEGVSYFEARKPRG